MTRRISCWSRCDGHLSVKQSKPVAASAIPIENIYYLLSYAWSHFHEGEELEVSAVSCPDVANLLGLVLASGVQRLARNGFERQYQEIQEETPRLRGRIRVAESHRRMTHRAGRMLCEFDELSGDTPANRILRTTVRRMLAIPGLTGDNRHLLRVAGTLLPECGEIRISVASFQRIQLHRNTRRYGLLLAVCRLIHQSLLPEEREGGTRFRDPLRDETVMHRLFEDFVRNFARKHCAGADVGAMKIGWVGEWDEEAARVLPGMLTDVTVAWPHRKLILDCKFYKEALVRRHDRHRLHSSHLYQLSSYLQNKSVEAGWENVEGILLYPAVEHQVSVSMTLLGKRMRVVSVDLDRPWTDIHGDLQGILRAPV